MTPEHARILIWESAGSEPSLFVQDLCALSYEIETVYSYAEVSERIASARPPALVIADLQTLLEQETERITPLLRRGAAPSFPLAVMTDMAPEAYLPHLRRLSLHHLFVKNISNDRRELSVLVDGVIDPLRGFGLLLHFHHTLEMYSLAVACKQSKNDAIERVVNHFATCGYEIHKLYNVRLILEELINNALFHAFRAPDGSEKYRMTTFTQLESGESVRIDYGSAAETVGFAVSDSAGALSPDTILHKIERQYNQEGLFDESGRGLYISRMLASSLIFNIEQGRRTQTIALFREKDEPNRPRPILINFVPAGAVRPPSAIPILAPAAHRPSLPAVPPPVSGAPAEERSSSPKRHGPPDSSGQELASLPSTNPQTPPTPLPALHSLETPPPFDAEDFCEDLD